MSVTSSFWISSSGCVMLKTTCRASSDEPCATTVMRHGPERESCVPCACHAPPAFARSRVLAPMEASPSGSKRSDTAVSGNGRPVS